MEGICFRWLGLGCYFIEAELTHSSNLILVLWFCAAGFKSRDDVPQLVEQYMAGKLKVDEFVSHNLPFEEVNKGFELMHSGIG